MIINLPLEVIYDPEKSEGIMHMTVGVATVTDDGKEIGRIAPCLGGGMELEDSRDGIVYFASLENIWEAFQQARKSDVGDGVRMIATERLRQVEKEGWTPEHDDQHKHHELLWAAEAYIEEIEVPGTGLSYWPPAWPREGFKPKDYLSNLVKAGALIAAEIDRVLRKKS